ncbi:Protein kinase domain containing protein [Aphelenchoides avenae]|nr:Protein kinase domain containing protein [Aphelenchus avenae]
MAVHYGRVLGDRWTIGAMLSEGGFGQVFWCKDVHASRILAVKVERLDAQAPLLAHEARCLRALTEAFRSAGKRVSEPILEFFETGITTEFRYMIMELGGKNLRELKKSTPFDRFSIPTSLWIAKKMLESLEFLHNSGWLHRDVKPANFCIGRGRHGTRQLFIVDFGTARNLNRKLNAEVELPEPRFHGFCGTLRYASLGVHDRGAQNVGKVDDLWSAYYLTVENANGQLPWRYINDRPLVANMKRTVLDTAVIMSQAPHPWFDFVQQPKSVQLMLQTLVQYTQHSTPDYGLLAKHFDDDLMAICENQFILDWEAMDTPQNRSHA